MPGLIGVARRATADAREVFDRLFAGVRRSGKVASESLVDPAGTWALGRVHHGIFEPGPQLRASDTAHVLVEGDLDCGAARAELAGRAGAQPVPERDAAVVAALHREHGAGLASHLRGSFAVAVLDSARRTLLLAADPLGAVPLYYAASPAGVVFGTELRALLLEPGRKVALDPRALADYLQFGFLLGEKTLAEGVVLVPAGATVSIDLAAGGEPRVARYRRMADSFHPWTDGREAWLDAVNASFRRSVARCVSGPHRFGIALSGGLDSRAVLAAIDRAGPPLASYTLGVKGCADEVIAEELARIAGTRHRFIELDERYQAQFLPNLEKMVALTDGMYLSHGLTEILALGYLKEADVNVLLRGHCGELMKASLAWPLHTDARVHALRSKAELADHLFARLSGMSQLPPLEDLLTGPWHEQVRGAARRALEESIEAAPESPADACPWMYLHEQFRRFTLPSLALFRSEIEVRLPFADAELIDVVFRGEARWRDGTELHRALIGRSCASMLAVRNSNTGAPAGAGPLAEKIYDKFNSLFKRLNVYGYRHYHSYEAWVKRMLLDSIEKTLLAPETLARGIYKESGLRKLIDATRAGADHGYLFQVLLIVELWQRQVGA